MFWSSKNIKHINVDIHSHLIPGIDDGAPTLEKSLVMIQHFHELGYKKLITTPHIHPRYPNSKNRIHEGLKKLKRELKNIHLSIEIEAAAEYYADDVFINKVKWKNLSKLIHY